MKKFLLLILKSTLVLIVLISIILIFSFRSDLPLDKLTSEYMDENSYFLKVDDIKVHIRVRGSGEPIFLIHGSFSSLHTWENWEKDLSQYFMTISMDLPGHGLTGPDPQLRYGINDYAHLVLGIANELGIEEFHIAGNSMGGGVALKLASDHPERVLTLNLIDAVGAPIKAVESTGKNSSPSRNSGALIFKVAQNPFFNKLMLKCTPKWVFKWNMSQVYYDDSKITDEQVTRYYQLLRREGNRKATLDRLTVRRPFDIDFSQLNMPVLIMWGAHDTWIPLENGKKLEDAIPESILKVYENAGHVPMEEIPTETVLDYLSFLGIQLDVDYFSAPKFYSHVH
ncbi:alpha/beta fold hydrolase [Shivajiella indica]|uniref:Alpha/beta fold hydrolase n=1 Tax=Shivajiella indica TaxID=872115 RepID=A0ABW5B8C3_9BACT